MRRAAASAARRETLEAVRRGHATVTALAEALGVTDNAVRLHLAALERDGLIARRGAVRSGRPGQPAVEYSLTPAGEETLSAAYAPALAAVVTSLTRRLDVRAARALLADAGSRMAGPPHSEGTLRQRADDCAALLESLGGAVDVRPGRHAVTLVGHGCPLSTAVRAEPATCTLVESLLERRCGVRVRQRCTHGEHPACRFELTGRAGARTA
jgi:predicted ArsR family transcriptional regulator